MKLRCRYCGEFESENAHVLPDFDACHDCIASLVEAEDERRGVAEQRRQFRQHWEGRPTAEDREHDQLKDAGRLR